MANEPKDSGNLPASAKGAVSPYSLIPSPFTLIDQAGSYWLDAFQRSILFLDVLRQRSNAQIEHEKSNSPTVLHFKYEMVLDGRKFLHPVNYHLLHILPPDGVATDPKKRPFIVFDPRAGQGPGIGGMKEDSQIGKALMAGHPCYFVGFLPKPVPGQTIEQVCEAEAIFIARVVETYPHADKPCLIGNCQAGWQVAMVCSVYPEQVGVLILAGAPLSYWNGVKGKDPMRYVGGIVGGSWPTAFASDLGNGCFDGATLVSHFELQNPATALWKKAYDLYSAVDTEAPRFLEFEKWWGSPTLLNKSEMLFISDSLFIGNRLSAARLRTSEGLRVDLRNIKAPILIFCSKGDDITPPPQALGWITDLYRNDNELIAMGQTIIYCLHQEIGHLGIFVSSSVASKEHDKFIQNIELIETLPPGLYEAVFTEKTESTSNPALATGDHVLKFEARSVNDIKKLGGNDVEDDRCFLAAKRASENLVSVYENYVSPWVRSISNEQTAQLLRQLNFVRLRYKLFSDNDPFMLQIARFAEFVKANRRPVSHDNFFWQLQEHMSEAVVAWLEAIRAERNASIEKLFYAIYGSGLLQSMLGLRKYEFYSKSAGKDVNRERDIQRRIHDLLTLATVGGLHDALVRGLLYIVRAGGGFDEREFRMLKQLCDASPTLPKMSSPEFKAMVRLQHEILFLDEKHAMEVVSQLLDSASEAEIKEALSAIRTVTMTGGDFTAVERKRFEQLEKYFVPSHASLNSRKSDVEVFGKHV